MNAEAEQLDAPRLTQDERRTARRQAILDAAEALFLEYGYPSVSLSTIVQRSGGSLATIYQMFGNKQGLLHAIAVRWRDETMHGRVNQVEASDTSAVEILMATTKASRIWIRCWPADCRHGASSKSSRSVISRLQQIRARSLLCAS